MVIVDSTVWVDYFNGFQTPETEWLDFQLEKQRLGITSLILCEVLQGLRSEREAAQVRDELLTLEVFDALTADVAVGADHAELRRHRYRLVDFTFDLFPIDAAAPGRGVVLAIRRGQPRDYP